MGAAAWTRRYHHAAVMAVLVASVAIVAFALDASVGAAAAAAGGLSAPHAVGTLATKLPAAEAWGSLPRPIFDVFRLTQAARQGDPTGNAGSKKPHILRTGPISIAHLLLRPNRDHLGWS